MDGLTFLVIPEQEPWIGWLDSLFIIQRESKRGEGQVGVFVYSYFLYILCWLTINCTIVYIKHTQFRSHIAYPTEYTGFLSSRQHWLPPPPQPQESVALPFWVQGGRHTRSQGRCGGPTSDDGTDTQVL